MKNIEISQITLFAIKNLLFNSNDGIDVSPIVEDLYTREEEKDLLAINIALIMKGAKPKIDMNPRFAYHTINKVRKYTPKHYSLIYNTITCEICHIEINENGDLKYSEAYNDTITAERFFNFSTDFYEVAECCKKHT